MHNQTNNIIRKIAEEYILDRDGKVMIGTAGVYRNFFRGIEFYAVDSLVSDEVTASIDPHKAIIKAMRLANVGGAGKVAASTAINVTKVVSTHDTPGSVAGDLYRWARCKNWLARLRAGSPQSPMAPDIALAFLSLRLLHRLLRRPGSRRPK